MQFDCQHASYAGAECILPVMTKGVTYYSTKQQTSATDSFKAHKHDLNMLSQVMQQLLLGSLGSGIPPAVLAVAVLLCVAVSHSHAQTDHPFHSCQGWACPALSYAIYHQAECQGQ